MGHGDGAGERLLLSHTFGVGFDDGREIGPAVAKEVFDISGRQQFQIGFGHACHFKVIAHHSPSILR